MSWLYNRQYKGDIWRFGHGIVRECLEDRRGSIYTAPIGLNLLFRYIERGFWWIRSRPFPNRLDCPCCGQRFARFQPQASIERVMEQGDGE